MLEPGNFGEFYKIPPDIILWPKRRACPGKGGRLFTLVLLLIAQHWSNKKISSLYYRVLMDHLRVFLGCHILVTAGTDILGSGAHSTWLLLLSCLEWAWAALRAELLPESRSRGPSGICPHSHVSLSSLYCRSQSGEVLCLHSVCVGGCTCVGRDSCLARVCVCVSRRGNMNGKWAGSQLWLCIPPDRSEQQAADHAPLPILPCCIA